MDSRSIEGSSFSLSTDGRTLPIAPIASVAPWMNPSPMVGDSYTVPIGGASLPTASSKKNFPPSLPLWCSQDFANRRLVISIYNDMSLNQYYLHYWIKPYKMHHISTVIRHCSMLLRYQKIVLNSYPKCVTFCRFSFTVFREFDDSLWKHTRIVTSTCSLLLSYQKSVINYCLVWVTF
jgi:hypothetical protein